MREDKYHLEQIADFLKSRLGSPLPGSSAHEPMRARPAGTSIPDFSHNAPPRPGSVLILLHSEAGAVRFPLIRRPEYIGTHGGQISLPGGKAEAGEDPVTTALREGEEEIGINPADVQVIGRLSTFHVIPSNYIVTPVVGILRVRADFVADPYEVAGIISCRVVDLVHREAIKEREVIAAGKYNLMAPHFEIQEQVVWGATAMILNEFRTILQEATD